MTEIILAIAIYVLVMFLGHVVLSLARASERLSKSVQNISINVNHVNTCEAPTTATTEEIAAQQKAIDEAYEEEQKAVVYDIAQKLQEIMLGPQEESR